MSDRQFDQLNQYVIQAVCEQLMKDKDYRTLSYLLSTSKNFRKHAQCQSMLLTMKNTFGLKDIILRQLIRVLQTYIRLPIEHPSDEINQMDIKWADTFHVTRFEAIADVDSSPADDSFWIRKDSESGLWIHQYTNEYVDYEPTDEYQEYFNLQHIIQMVAKIEKIEFVIKGDNVLEIDFNQHVFHTQRFDPRKIPGLVGVIRFLVKNGFTRSEHHVGI